MTKIILWIFLLLSANIVIPSSAIDMRTGQEIINIFCLSTILIVFLVSWQAKIKPLDKLIGLFWIWAIITSFYVFTNITSITALVNISLYILLYWIAKNVITTTNDKQTTLNIICIGAIIQTAYCIFQSQGYNLVFNLGFINYTIKLKPEMASFPSRMIGTLGHPNIMAAYLALCFPAFLRNKPVFSWYRLSYVKWWWFTPVVLFPFIQGNMRGGFVSLVIGLTFWSLFCIDTKKWVKILVITALTGAMGLYLLHFGINTGRMKIAENVYHLSDHILRVDNKVYITSKRQWDKTFIGHGPGQFKVLFPIADKKYREINKDPHTENCFQAHNEYLQTKFEMGFIGLGIALLFLAFFSIRYWRGRRRVYSSCYEINNIAMTGVIIICVNSLVNFTFHIPAIAPLMMIYFGLVRGNE